MNGVTKRGYSGAQRTEMAAERKRWWWFIRIGSVKPRELGNSIDLLGLRQPIRHLQVARVNGQRTDLESLGRPTAGMFIGYPCGQERGYSVPRF